jgi:hypothetical protein
MKEIYKTFDCEFELNGHDVVAKVTVSFVIDQYFDPHGDITFDSKEDKDKFLKDLETGKLSPIVIFVTASALGETGGDSLSGCIIEKASEIDGLVEDHDMVVEAVRELKDSILCKIEALRHYMGEK